MGSTRTGYRDHQRWNSEFAMLKSQKGPLPRTSVLRAFEAAARHGSFTAAANELEIQQPAVRRLIAELEHEVRVQLFERSRRAVILSPAGEVFHRAVTSGLERMAAGTLSASCLAEDRRVVVACGRATSHLFVMPRFGALRRKLGPAVDLQVLTLDHGMLDGLDQNEIDLVLGYNQAAGPPEDRLAVFSEAIMPVCSPEFAAAHAAVLARPVEEWGALPFLRFGRSSLPATWHDWFDSVGYPSPRPRYVGIEDYVYLLEAAVAGEGLALGWRHLVDRYLEAGSLIAVADRYVEFDRSCFARLTERGRRRGVARRSRDALGALVTRTVRRPESASAT